MHTEDINLVGNYTLSLLGTYDTGKGTRSHTLKVKFNVTLELPAKTYLPEIEHVYFTVQNHEVDISEGFTL